MNRMADSLFHLIKTAPRQPVDLFEIMGTLLFAAALGLLLSLLYIRIGDAKRKMAFTQALVLLPLVVSAVMLIIGNNLVRAFGLIGAISIIRFRTVIKNSRDMTFVFMAITMGMASGSALPVVALLATVFFGVVAWAMKTTGYGRNEKRVTTGRHAGPTRLTVNNAASPKRIRVHKVQEAGSPVMLDTRCSHRLPSSLEELLAASEPKQER